MSRPEDPASNVGRIRAYFDANRDEFLTVDNIALKLDITPDQVRNALVHLKRRCADIGTDYFVYRKAAD